MRTREEQNARGLANLLWAAQAALTRYRVTAQMCGVDRRALSDLATFDELESLAQDREDVDDPSVWARDVMAKFIAAGERPSLGGDDRHFAEAVYGGHADEVHDALERLGLLPKEEDDG